MDRWEAVGLTREEYDRIVQLIGRDPNDLELGLFGLMWSEHCSYKSSKIHLGVFPTEGERVLVGPGENAGVLDLGGGLAVAARVESHNHPSAIEPYQGAATGVGGIIRDIFTMGARPIALLDSLRFGELGDPRVRYLFGGVVAGIAGYGNCIGIPTVGGEVYFDPCYRRNPLVNVMCVGLIEKEKIVLGRAEGPGNAVFLVGAKTGRDGIHGASLLASREFDESPEEMRPAVQVGDPFLEKLLVEACLELMESDAVVGVNDLGAAGLTSACSETAARAGNGMEIDVALVRRRETGMVPYEVMLSESQERMLVIVREGREEEVRRVFARWGLDSALIGRVTGDGLLRVKDGDEVVAEIPARVLAREAPVYDRPRKRPSYLDEAWSFDLATVRQPERREEWEDLLALLLSSPNIASKAWVYEQYDYMVRTNTVLYPGADAAVMRLKGTSGGLALTLDANARYAYLDPFTGGAAAVAEAARNVVCTGARPIGLTNCLNFGNPERPEIMWQFREVIEGMSAAARTLDTPVIGGNVSFYNETSGQNVFPTPVVGMLGLIENLELYRPPWFQSPGDVIVLMGRTLDELGGSEYLKLRTGLITGRPPVIDLDLEKRVQQACLEAITAGLIRSAHDLSEGGLAVALAEACFGAGEGAGGCLVEVAEVPDLRLDAFLFGESQSRILVTVSEHHLPALHTLLDRHGVPRTVLGSVTGDSYTVRVGGRALIDVRTRELKEKWTQAISRALA